MLKGIQKNLIENYNQIIELKRKDQLKNKEDVIINEAFELYMLKKFHGIKLNTQSKAMLSFWEKDFDQAIEKHIDFLKENLEFQNEYSSKFSEILQEMEIFQNENNEEENNENQEDGQNNPSNDDQESDTEDKKDQNKEDETNASLDSDYEVDEYRLAFVSSSLF
jgi:cobaltochelatase CobT